MSSISLEAGKRALMAQRMGLDVTSNNIANVNTPGYSRRTPNLRETDPFLGRVTIGTGVMVKTMRTYREEFFDKEIRSTTSRNASYGSDNQIIERIESILAEPSDMGIGELTAKFFNSFEQLANNPEDLAHRDFVMDMGQTLVERFHMTSAQFTDLRAELRTSIGDKVDSVNTMLGQIADMNKNIVQAGAKNQQEVQTFVDRREQLLEELSGELDITVAHEKNGTVNVFSNGINLITAADAGKVGTQETINPNTGERTINIVKLNRQNEAVNIIRPRSGELGSRMKHYNVTLDDNESSEEFSAFKKLDDFANAIVKKVNQHSMEGYGLDDNAAASPGRAFFEPAVGDATATTIEISEDIKGKPRDLPVSGAPGEPGNNDVARKIARITEDNAFLDSLTPQEFYSGFLGKIGTMGKEAKSGENTTRLVADQLTNQRESVIGVNLDEEAVNLIKYQKAFEASSRVINTTNEILATIVNLGR